jgi:hypothetical protein
MIHTFPSMSNEEAAQYPHVEVQLCENNHRFDGLHKRATVYFMRPVGSKCKDCLDCRIKKLERRNTRQSYLTK